LLIMMRKPINAVPNKVFESLTLENRRHISDELFLKLRDAILSGELPEGYIFPNENELCQQLNIGRGSLREAYSSLETLHLITRTKAGTYVNSLDEIQNNMNFVAIAERTDAQNLREYRQIVETGTARLAAQKATDDDIQNMEKILCSMRASGDDPTKLSQLDFDFHSSLVRITGNELLIIAFNTIRSIYEDYTENTFARGYFKQSLGDHQAILEALRARDPKQAAAMMDRHLGHVEEFRNVTED
jgi:GntR family transcriptional repressor for pyruvate dehydrogenase complex